MQIFAPLVNLLINLKDEPYLNPFPRERSTQLLASALKKRSNEGSPYERYIGPVIVKMHLMGNDVL